MTDTSANNRRIAKNTLLLYFRMIFMMLVSLYTSRVVLDTLGVEDYGIYNVVGGVVAMFGFINGSMSSATQRYITFALGKDDMENLQKVFNTALQIHVLISILIVLLGETVGLWFMYNQMQIPADRMDAAFWVLQCSILSTAIVIISVPYNADIIAHEKMSAFAYISILEAVLKLIIVYLLVLSSYDKLIFYAFLILVVQLLIRFCYNFYCNKHFPESKCRYLWDKSLFKKMTMFAGWSMWGNLASILSTQGVNLLLNVFFGPTVNAARGMAIQIQSAVSQFSSNFQVALNPQITKTYAQNDLQSMNKLIIRSSKFSFFLLFILSLPILLMTQPILEFWLKLVPEYTAIFLKISLVIVIIDSMSNPIMIAASATGNIRTYQSIIGGIVLLIIPLAYVVLKLGAPPFMVYVIHLFISVTAAIVRLLIIRTMIFFKIRLYLYKVLKSICPTVCLSLPIPMIMCHYLVPSQLSHFLLIFCACVLLSVLSVYATGLDKNEKKVINDKLLSLLRIRK